MAWSCPEYLAPCLTILRNAVAFCSGMFRFLLIWSGHWRLGLLPVTFPYVRTIEYKIARDSLGLLTKEICLFFAFFKTTGLPKMLGKMRLWTNASMNHYKCKKTPVNYEVVSFDTHNQVNKFLYKWSYIKFWNDS